MKMVQASSFNMGTVYEPSIKRKSNNTGTYSINMFLLIATKSHNYNRDILGHRNFIPSGAGKNTSSTVTA
jgi:hypothetical protein